MIKKAARGEGMPRTVGEGRVMPSFRSMTTVYHSAEENAIDN
jgi:hypothetical protein